jgi:hypothetical protein
MLETPRLSKTVAMNLLDRSAAKDKAKARLES